jgi:hypothetical protein
MLPLECAPYLPGLARNAGIGMCASFVSDCISNSLRVVKTIKQTSGNVDKVRLHTHLPLEPRCIEFNSV